MAAVFTIGLRTSSKKSATSAAAGPVNFLRTLRSPSLRNFSNTWKKKSDVVSVSFNATKLSGRVMDGFAVSPSDWSMEMLTISNVYPTEYGKGEQGQKCPYI